MIPKLSGLSLCLVLAILGGCDEGVESENSHDETRLFTLSVDASYNTSKSEDWIIVHDENGKTLVSESFEASQDIVLRTDQKLSKNTIGITFLKITVSRGKDYFSLRSYLNIEKGKTALLRTKNSPSAGKNVGIFDVILEGTTSPDQFSLSTKHGMLYSGGIENKKLKLKGFLYSSSNEYLFQVTDFSGNPRYKMLGKVKPNDSYSLAFDHLNPFDKIVEFTFPMCNRVDLVVRGRKPDQSFNDPGYTLNNHFIADHHSKIKAGYLDDLSKYETDLSLKYSDYSYVYKNIGSIPDGKINWPSKSAFKIKESAIENFHAESSTPFIWRHSTWKLENTDITRPDMIIWDVYSSSTDQLITELPQQILSAHSTLTVENLKYKGTTFYTQSEPYADYIDKILKDDDKSATGEQVGIVVY